MSRAIENKKINYSILELANVPYDGTVKQTLNDSLAVAQQAESLGYKRFWLAEHHNAGAAVDGLGHLQGGFAVGSLNGSGDLLHGGTRPLCKFLSLYHDDAAIWITDC